MFGILGAEIEPKSMPGFLPVMTGLQIDLFVFYCSPDSFNGE
jgi:hypothetical protein